MVRVDREPGVLAAIPFEDLEPERVDRGGAGTGVDLRSNYCTTEVRQAYPLAPSDDGRTFFVFLVRSRRCLRPGCDGGRKIGGQRNGEDQPDRSDQRSSDLDCHHFAVRDVRESET
jgi:hypothetical protein